MLRSIIQMNRGKFYALLSNFLLKASFNEHEFAERCTLLLLKENYSSFIKNYEKLYDLNIFRDPIDDVIISPNQLQASRFKMPQIQLTETEGCKMV